MIEESSFRKLRRECVPTLDISELWERKSPFATGCEWRDRGGERVAMSQVGWLFDYTFAQTKTLINESQTGRIYHQELSVMPTPCRYGGFRRSWICRLCAKQTQQVHFREDRTVWACAKCQKLTYPSQHMSPAQRITRKHLQLSGEIGSGRPRYMHQKTYDRKVAHLAAVNAKLSRLGRAHSYAELHNHLRISYLPDGEFLDMG